MSEYKYGTTAPRGYVPYNSGNLCAADPDPAKKYITAFSFVEPGEIKKISLYSKTANFFLCKKIKILGFDANFKSKKFIVSGIFVGGTPMLDSCNKDDTEKIEGILSDEFSEFSKIDLPPIAAHMCRFLDLYIHNILNDEKILVYCIVDGIPAAEC